MERQTTAIRTPGTLQTPPASAQPGASGEPEDWLPSRSAMLMGAVLGVLLLALMAVVIPGHPHTTLPELGPVSGDAITFGDPPRALTGVVISGTAMPGSTAGGYSSAGSVTGGDGLGAPALTPGN